MKTVNIHDAKTNLSRLVAAAAAGESFVIARAGKPLVKVTAIAPEPAAASRLNLLPGVFAIPGDFDRMGDRIADDFEG
ncbi:type II toxin-antitoxin system Phd/YefM family antitoxin [Palleronia abyssalis]|uniref:Antitoxin n=1 Tax=Palleronia abyssalis TaxID=1501240 RepID=A0A2R8C1A7_9RHOB|nr:type II toxin-antitoxin system prevent-host-death family antitoxin [Palleronia abyssalis]SPJ26170.1 hypothetical protein PAA8504_04026 [Palleronia abyssalis]